MEDPNIIVVGVIFALLVVAAMAVYGHKIKARIKIPGAEVEIEASNADPAPEAQTPTAEPPVSSIRQATIETQGGNVTVEGDINVTIGEPSKKALPPKRGPSTSEVVQGRLENANERQPITVRWLREHGVLDELASVFDTAASAASLLERAGVPRERVRPFGQMTLVEFWEAVCRQLEKGLTQGGLASLLEAAAGFYPHNEIFQRAFRPDDEKVLAGDDKIQTLGPSPVATREKVPTMRAEDSSAPSLGESSPVSIVWHEGHKAGNRLAIRILNNTDSLIENLKVLARDLALWDQRNQRFVRDDRSKKAVYLNGKSPIRPKSLAEESNRRDLVVKHPKGFHLPSGSSQYKEIVCSIKGIWRVEFTWKIIGGKTGWCESYLYFEWNPDETPELHATPDPKAELAEKG